MIAKLREKYLDICFRIQQRAKRRRCDPLPPMRGNMRRVLVVKPPDPMFSEAVFILKDDFFQTPGISRQELLQQAKRAAEECTSSGESCGRVPFLPSAAIFALGAACTVMSLWLAGII